MTTPNVAIPIKVDEAKQALTLYLDDAKIFNASDRYRSLNRFSSKSWFIELSQAGLAEGLDVWDVIAGKDALMADLIWQMPTGSGKSNPALLAMAVQP